MDKQRFNQGRYSVVTTLLAMFFIYASALQAQSESADWKFLSTSGENKDAMPDLLVFYLNNDVKRLPSGHIEVWTKGLSTKEVTVAFNKIRKHEAITDRIAKKLKEHYDPPYARIHKLTDDDRMGITAWEEFANEANMSPQMRILFELDCPGKMIRELSIWRMIHGKSQSSDTATEWSRIAPETNGSALSLLLCPSS